MAALTSGKTNSGKLSWLLPANMQEIGFKPTPGGYVFKAPSPRLFGKSCYVLLTEAQKREILAMRPSPRQGAYAIVVGIGVAIIVGLATALGARSPIMWVGVAALLLMIAMVSNCRYARMVEPVVAKAQPTELRITFMDRLQAQAANWPMKGLVVFAALHTLMFILQALAVYADRGEPASSLGWLPYLGMALFGFFAFYMFSLIVLRMRVGSQS
jgi:hypothetical protein